MSNIYEIIKDVSGEWCESLSADEASSIVCEITDYKVRMLSALKNFETNGIEHDGVRKAYEGLKDIFR